MLKRIIFVSALMVSLIGTGFAGDNQKQVQKPTKININKADQQALQLLPGVGSTYAKRIIQYRKQHGNFDSVKGLKKVKGVGKKTIKHVQSLATVSS